MKHLLVRPRMLGLVCGAGAVGLGLAYMAAAGAPPSYLLVNLAALILGAVICLGLGRWGAVGREGLAVVALALPLLATAILAPAIEGASRWVTVGPLSLQVSLILLPAMILLYARRPDALGTIGIAIAALALAVQPDRAMAGVLAAGIGAMLVANRGGLPAFAFAAALAGFGAAMLRADALPAVPFVDGILYTSFGVHPLAGMAVVAGCLLLLAPAVVAARRGMQGQRVAAAFGACWAAVILAAALGNYPTPLVGYGGSAILGYLLSVALLPRRIQGSADTRSAKLIPPGASGADSGAMELSGISV